MSEFAGLLNTLPGQTPKEKPKDRYPDQTVIKEEVISPVLNERKEPFDTSKFADELKNVSEMQNRMYAEVSTSINAYSVAHDCIMNTVKKLLNYPVKSFAHRWLPILMRSTIGTAIHNLIQDNTKQFTETEVSVKVPSIKFSGRLDAIMGNNCIVEIKSCTYTDYEKIIKTQTPRQADFFQVMTYKYIIENYLNEIQTCGIQTRTPVPILSNYNIDTLQFIYIAHDICSADVEDFGQALKVQKQVKQMLNSKYNPFYFMTSVVLDTKCFDTQPILDFIKNKIAAINYYIDANKLPTITDPFIDSSKCFFCLYQDNCEIKSQG